MRQPQGAAGWQRRREHVPKGSKGAALSERAARVLRESSQISRLQRVGNAACLDGISHTCSCVFLPVVIKY